MKMTTKQRVLTSKDIGEGGLSYQPERPLPLSNENEKTLKGLEKQNTMSEKKTEMNWGRKFWRGVIAIVVICIVGAVVAECGHPDLGETIAGKAGWCVFLLLIGASVSTVSLETLGKVRKLFEDSD